MSGVSLSEPPAQCGTANNNTTNTTPSSDLCSVGTLSGVVSQADQDSWTWSCASESSNAQCSSSCEINEWICGNSCISILEPCGNNDSCPLGYTYNSTSDSCEINTGACPAGQTESPVGSGTCITNTGDFNGEITAFQATPRIINSGDQCNLNWVVYTEDASTVLCEVISDEPGESADRRIVDPEEATSGTVTYANVTSSTNYTMSCYGATPATSESIKTKTGDALSTKTARCIINPNFREF